jgi:hypothetical protein
LHRSSASSSTGRRPTVVTNLNAIGVSPTTSEGDRLLFTDNGGTFMGATNGDTVYALPNPRGGRSAGRRRDVDAAAERLDSFAQAVLPLSGGDILIGDAAGPGVGRVVKLSGGVPTNLITGSTTSRASPPRSRMLATSAAQHLRRQRRRSFVPSLTRYTTRRCRHWTHQ